MALKPTTTTLLLSFIHASLAQQSILSLPFYGYDTQTILASVISANPTATTLSLACPTQTGDSGSEDAECGLAPLQTLIYGPSTYHMDLSVPGQDGATLTQDCVSTTICAVSAGGEGANSPGLETVTFSGDEIETMPVTITAGLSKLQGGAAAATTTSSASATASLTTLTGGGGSMTSGGSETTASETGAAGATTTGDGGAGVGRGSAEGLGVLAAVVGFLGVLI